MMAVMIVGMVAIVVARSVSFAGLPEQYRVLGAFVALIPVLVLLSTMHGRFDTGAYVEDRGWAGAVGDVIVVLGLAAVGGGVALTGALATGLPVPIGIGAVVAYAAALLFFRTRNDRFYMDRDEVVPEQEIPSIDDYPEDVQEDLREE
jgi:hypothetical protein